MRDARRPKPAEADPKGESYAFEKGVEKVGGGKGFVDVWYRGHFAVEYKGKHKDLSAAYEQSFSGTTTPLRTRRCESTLPGEDRRGRLRHPDGRCCASRRPVLRSSSSGYRAPCTVICDAALSISRRSSGVSSISAAPMFSSRRSSFRVPGIGTIHGF